MTELKSLNNIKLEDREGKSRQTVRQKDITLHSARESILFWYF